MERALYEKIRKEAFNIRKNIIMTVVNNGEGHAGPALSCADILATIYFAVKKQQDKFILSAGHKCLALYGTLVQFGTIDMSVLDTYNKLGSPIPGHPDMYKLPGVDFSTGSLGHGLGVACGFAKAAKLAGTDRRCFVVMGDGEQAEGTVWEAAALAAHHKLDNIIAFVDRNHLQVSGQTTDVMSMESLEEKYQAFGWNAVAVNGHDIAQLYDAICQLPCSEGKPTVFICDTVKGKGLPFAENNARYHHWDPDENEKKEAVRALQAQAEKEGWEL